MNNTGNSFENSFVAKDLLIAADLAFRIFVLIVAIALGALVVLLGSREAMAASLKPTAIIKENVFTVGDLFSGLTQEKASHILGAAPQPGDDMTLNARTLMRIAVAMDLPWRPSSTMDQIIIRRDAVKISTNQIETAISSALKNEGLDDRFELTFYGTAQPTIVLPSGEETDMQIAALNFDRQNDRFEARLVAPSIDEPKAELLISGKIERLLPVPVIKTTLSRGDIIDSYDIEWIDMKSSDIQDDIILNADDLIDMAPRRILVSGKPVRRIDLEYPQLVGRGQTISITYKDGFLNLSAKGKSMQNGAKGDIVRVVNLSSNRSIEAMVTGDGRVTVTP